MNPIRILLLEDSAVDAELIAAYLAESQLICQLERVATRADFLAAIATDGFDLVLADYSLPDFDGVSALRLVKARSPNLPFLFISGTLGEELAVEMLKSGATDYILKQRLQRLVPSVERAIREQRSRSEQQRMEQELYRREQEFRALVENSPDLIFRCDRDLCYTYVNPAVATALGIPTARFFGKTPAELPLPQAACYQWQTTLSQVARTSREQTLILTLPAPDGQECSYQVRVVPELAPDGSVESVLSVARDFSEQKQLFAREQLARAEAEAANRVKDEFLAVLSHELRTPLNSILGYTQLLRAGRLDASKTEQALATIERNARLQTQLIEDLLDVSRLLRGKLHLAVGPVNLQEILQATAASLQLAAQAKSLQIQLDLDPRSGLVLGDANRLQQIAWNLLSNAIKFTPTGGQISIRLRENEGAVELQVADTGQGISPEFLPFVFEYFRQEDSSSTRANAGLGLGLAITRHLVELHGGTITAKSAGPSQGATFTVCLPLMPPSPLPVNDAIPDASLSLAGMRVLIVDDEADTRALMPLVFAAYGAEAIAVGSAAEALARLRDYRPDILVSDISMPDLDGCGLLAQIRALPPDQGGQIPAIALTAHAREEDRLRVLAAGFQLHCVKPVNPDQLAQAVSGLATPNGFKWL
ncbi:MAG: response regulator [Chloroflexaceae bacterium]|nr:response regulator [Chloroflexaceae bacterium]